MEPLKSDLMKQRTSWRSYVSVPLEKPVMDEVRAIIGRHGKGPLGKEVEWIIIDRHDGSHKREKLGTYGFIQNARYFIGGSSLPERYCFLDYGYLMEAIILELTAIGLGTCWLGGTFNRGEFAKAIGLKPGLEIPAVTPFGYTSRVRSLGDRIIRTTAGSRNRKAWSELFFENAAGKPLVSSQHPECTLMLEMIRIAPSASNLQPWRIICHGKRIDFYLDRKPGYRNTFGNVDIQMLDMGIAFCHFDLAAAENGIVPIWNNHSDAIEIKGWEYVLSAVI